MNILFIGDIMGRAGREAVFDHIYDIKERSCVDFCIANCENAAGGFGATQEIVDELIRAGVDAFTTGNHVFSKKSIVSLLGDISYDIIRPCNLPQGDPGRGYMICNLPNGEKLAIINMLGRLYIDLPTENPFAVIDGIVEEVSRSAKYIIVDIHAEATSEKKALGYYLDGRVSAVLGTHTHVQTADEEILPKGTAYITDVGMCGARNSVLGASIDVAVKRFTSGLPNPIKIAEGERFMNAVLITLGENGLASGIERIFIR